jgi:hypothetical protein
MDQAWKLEQESWQAAASGNASDFYREHMTTDGFLVVPNALYHRHQLIGRWEEREPLTFYELSEPHIVLVDGESVLLTYRVVADGGWLPNYRARVSSLYTWSGGTWALSFRQHTPDVDQPFPF